MIKQCNNFTPAKIEDIQDHVHNTYHWRPNASWVSKFCFKNKIRSHTTQKRPSKRNRDTIESEKKDFTEMINTETAKQKKSKKKRTRVWHVDEKGLWDNDINNRGYSYII